MTTSSLSLLSFSLRATCTDRRRECDTACLVFVLGFRHCLACAPGAGSFSRPVSGLLVAGRGFVSRSVPFLTSGFEFLVFTACAWSSSLTSTAADPVTKFARLPWCWRHKPCAKSASTGEYFFFWHSSCAELSFSHFLVFSKSATDRIFFFSYRKFVFFVFFVFLMI